MSKLYVSLAALVISFLLRILLKNDHLQFIRELAPVGSNYISLKECIFYLNKNIDFYNGGICHHHPLTVVLFDLLGHYSHLFMALLDTLSGYFIHRISKGNLNAVALHLILSLPVCLAMDISVLNNFLLFYSIYAMTVLKKEILSMVLISVSAYLSLYNVLFIPSLVLLSQKKRSFLVLISTVVLTIGAMFYVNSELLLQHDSVASYLHGTFGFLLNMPDLTPSLSLYWYFFAEMFDTFRSFFVLSCQLIIFSFCIPITVKLRKDGMFAICLLSGVLVIFKSYTSIGDFALFVTLLMINYNKVGSYLKNYVISYSIILFSLLLIPSFKYIWLYTTSGNANFYYAITLVFHVGLVVLMIDLFGSYLRRVYDEEVEQRVKQGDTEWLKYRNLDLVLK